MLGQALAIPVLLLALLLGSCSADQTAQGNRSLTIALGDQNLDGYRRADAARAFRFPKDHGAHPEFRNEWWYFTGNLQTPEGRRFAYQWVLFRIALSPQQAQRSSNWASNQLYMAHFAITDEKTKQFRYFERFSRGALGLAGAQSTPFRIWLEDWQVQALDKDSNSWTLQAGAEDISLSLTLTPRKPLVLQGDNGLSRKSEAPGSASYYYSLTRLETTGSITIAGNRHEVQGLSWLDREWSSTALAENQQGWDWFSIQLSNGYDLMLYRIRNKDGGIDPFSSGSLIDPRGSVTVLEKDDFVLESKDSWTSPRGGDYPVGWRIHVKPAQLDLDIRPLLPDQELDVAVRYWEGAISVSGSQGQEKVSGRGYLEMTGYAE